MWSSIPTYRAVCFGVAAGPWRLRLTAARRDAIGAGLGCYDEFGSYFDIVPGDIQIKHACPKLLGLSEEQLDELFTSERRAKLSVRQLQMGRRSKETRDVRHSKNRAQGGLGRT